MSKSQGIMIWRVNASCNRLNYSNIISFNIKSLVISDRRPVALGKLPVQHNESMVCVAKEPQIDKLLYPD